MDNSPGTQTEGATKGTGPFVEPIRRILETLERIGPSFAFVPVEVAFRASGAVIAVALHQAGVRALVPEMGAWEGTARALADRPQECVLVLGHGVPAPDLVKELHLLNQGRDAVARRRVRPVFWCGDANFLRITQREAPDLWSAREISIFVDQTEAAEISLRRALHVARLAVRSSPVAERRSLLSLLDLVSVVAHEAGKPGPLISAVVSKARALVAIGEADQALDVLDAARKDVVVHGSPSGISRLDRVSAEIRRSQAVVHEERREAELVALYETGNYGALVATIPGLVSRNIAIGAFRKRLRLTAADDEDLIAEVTARLLEKDALTGWSRETPLTPFLEFRIQWVARECLRRWKVGPDPMIRIRKVPSVENLSPYTAATFDTESAMVERDAALRALERVMQGRSEPEGRVLAGMLGGETAQETATVLGVANGWVAAVRVRLRRLIREVMAEEGL